MFDLYPFVSDGYTLGGHCYMWGICHVENSKCFYGFTDKTSSNYCRCLFGYQDSGKNTCVKIPGILELAGL